MTEHLGQSGASDSMADRAARYFGVACQPRISILVTRPRGAMIVTRIGDRVMLLLYREWPQVGGEHVALTDVQRAKLIAALSDA